MKRVLFAVITFFLGTVTVFAEEEPSLSRGSYLGFGIVSTTLGGDFDGRRNYRYSDEVFAIPELSSGFGLEGLLGFRKDHWGFELGLSGAGSRGRFGIDDYETFRIQSYLLGKVFLVPKARFQPFLSIGLGGDILLVDDGSVDANNVSGHEVFSGFDLRFGGGFSVFLTPRFAVNLKGEMLRALFNSVEGVKGTRRNIEPALKGGGFACGLYFSYIFN